MDYKAEIRAALRDMVRDMLTDQSVQATVKSVDKAAGTLVATGVKEGVDYFDVRLTAVLADQVGAGVLAYPVVGSQVSVTILDGIDTMAFVSQYSDIEEFVVKTAGGVTLALKQNGELHLNGEQFEGLVKAPELQKQLEKTNAVVAAIQRVLTASPGWMPVQVDGIGLKAAMNVALAGKMVGTFSNLQNPNVKHG
ncbi:hypothetical protein SAMN02745146_0101 [Hymenobacter daecheongensis DSM 21074]|uniref:Uncharacterized protein n=1 Tax=Hymenobacter daecheongensis DSM 21074 TaxID=1121955 RepID=A0A1M6LYC3_9BACT|nr:hypothetical protein [Hymenobacter daecheongensis]SHJ76189.1 hypothetical protein SAMN02745146_0101 [Hymenobacter daecheongensis DSM 21074]